MLNAVVSALLLLLLGVAVLLALLGLRHRLAFRIGLRNAYRARARTILLVLGLLVATTIISGSLVVGDTVSEVAVHYTVVAIGLNDELVGNQSPSGAYSAFPYSVYSDLRAQTLGNPSIAGMAPEVVGRASVFDRSSGVPQPALYLIGANANQSTQLGQFVADNGTALAGPSPGRVLLDDLAASELNASVGDSVLLYGANLTPTPSLVQAVVQDAGRGGFPTGGLGNFGSVFTDLPLAQQVENLSGELSVVSVTNVGDQANRLASAPALSASLNATLAGIPAARGLSSQPLLVTSLATARSDGSGITTLFLVLGLFALLAGSMLIVGIFVLLAEERKGEMGVLRALGLPSRELVYAFLFEGTAYSAGGAFAGTFLGAAVGYGLTYAIGTGLNTGLPLDALLASYTVTTETLVTAYVVGFLLTLITVGVAGQRASHLNIVRAIRDIPDPPPARRTYTAFAYLGTACAALGALLFASTYRGTADLSYPILGGALILIGAALVAARFAPNRPVFSCAGAALLVWAGAQPLHAALLGSEHGGGIYIVFTDGVVMVTGALLLYAFNASALSTGIQRMVGGRNRRAPVALVALAYPSRRPGRTTISLAIFALVIFTLVLIAGAGSTVEASLSTTLHQQSGGYSFFAYSAVGIPDLPRLVDGNATVAPFFSAVVPLVSGGVYVNVSGFPANPYPEFLRSAPAGGPSASSFYSTNQFTFSATQGGRSASALYAELESTPNVAIVDQTYSPVANNLAVGSSGPHPTVNPGDSVEITNPRNGERAAVTVIGVMAQSLLTGIFVSPPTAAALGISEANNFFLTLAPGASALRAAQVAKAAFFSYGLVVLNIADLLASSVASTEGLLGLLQVFIALGLGVGIAAMAIVALRAVVERRRDIGMLRATGFTQGMVLRAFFLEYSFITLVGIAIGTALGLLLVWDLTQGPNAVSEGVSTFAVPWRNLAIFLGTAYGLSMLAVAAPSVRAARLPPADAVRTGE